MLVTEDILSTFSYVEFIQASQRIVIYSYVGKNKLEEIGWSF